MVRQLFNVYAEHEIKFFILTREVESILT
uniref:Uncharacterized protein n=1 Tax=Anguilla anguilla TaxID=7936 RepID=A0A0E9PB68_ANGAN